MPPDVRRVVTGRAIRGFADGFVSVLLAQYLTGLGFSPVEVGAIVTGTLLGSAVLTLAFGLTGHRFTLRALLLAATGLMVATGLGFASVTAFWPLLVIAAVGHAQPVGRRRQRVPADRAGARRRPRRRRRADRGCSRSTTCARSSPVRSARSCRVCPKGSRTHSTGTSRRPRKRASSCTRSPAS